HLAEILQMHAMSGRTGCLQVQHNDLTGEIYLHRGLVTHAVCRALMGEKAFALILSWPSPSFNWQPNTSSAISTLQASVQDLLIQQAFGPQWTEDQIALLLTFGDPDLDAPEPSTISDDEVLFCGAVRGKDCQPFWFRFSEEEAIIGRVADFCHIVILDPSVSGKHAALRLAGHRLQVRDLGSTNGTKVNGSLVTQAEIRIGQSVGFGNTVLEFFALDPQGLITDGTNLPQGTIQALLSDPEQQWNTPSLGLLEALPPGFKRQTAKIEPPSRP
ncbi:MAG: FHA domain-containing protein, partial [Verrucomicrobiia bacterium]